MARFLRTDTNSSGGHSRLRPPVVVTTPTPFVARPVQVNPATDALRRNFRVVARIPKSHLPQVPIVGAGIAFHGPGVRLADPRSPNTVRNARKPFSFVRAPVVVGVGIVFRPVQVNPAVDALRRSFRVVARIPKSHLFAPAVVTPVFTGVAPPIHVTLVRTRPFPTDASVFKPAVIAQAQGPQGGVGIQLAPSSRGLAKSHLFPPILAAVTFVASPVEVKLARSSRGTAKPRLLRVPTAFRPIGFTINTQLAYSKRGTPKSRLKPPTVIDLTPQVFFVERTLVRIKHPPVLHRLFPPTDLVDQQDLGFVRVHLAYSRRGTPKSVLRKPTVVAPVLARRIDVTFAPQKRGVPKSVLHAPVVVAPVLARKISTKLVRIRPVATRWLLRKPVDLVDAADVGFVRVHLAYSLRGKPKSRLVPPAVVAPVLARPIDTTLARIRPVPVHTVLRRPVDLVDQQDIGFVRVHLVRIRPVAAHAALRSPVAIDLSPQTKYLDLHLAYSRRGAPKSLLRQASLFSPQPKAETVLAVTLAYSLRGKAKSFLRAPVVVTAATPYLRPIDVTLAPQSRGKAKSRFAPPTVFAPVPPVQGELRGGRRLRLESIYDEDDWLAVILGEV